MWRSIAILVAAALCGAGCGSPTRGIAPSKPAACPDGVGPLEARDLIGRPPPAGYEVVPGDRKALKEFAMQFRPSLGDAWRGYDAAVLVRRDKMNGAAVVVLNAGERTGGNEELIRGMEAGARERGADTEPIQIAGQEGRMVRAPDGAYLAMAPTGECAAVVVVADRATLVRDAASVIPEG
jgi:hypothetical protein